MSEDMDEIPEPANLRFLRVLVTVLTTVMILGVVTVTALLVTRLRAPTVPAPADLALPEGIRPLAVTAGPGWSAVVTDDNRILIFDASGAMMQEIPVTLPQ